MLPVAWVGLLALIAFIGTIGNIFIIGAVCLCERLRVRGNVFIVNLAVADLIITAYIMPVGLASSRFEGAPFGQLMCDINAFLVMTSCGVSTQSLMMIAVERYLHICKTSWYRQICHARAVGVYVGLTWVYTIAWTCQGWTGWTRYHYGLNVYFCLFEAPYSLSYNLCLAFFGMVLPMIVLVFCYVNIFTTVSGSSKALAAHALQRGEEGCRDPALVAARHQQKRKLKREKRMVMTLFVIVLVYAIFWLPASMLLILAKVLENKQSFAYTATVWAALCNSSINSFLYGAMNKNFRRGYTVFFRKIFCVQHCAGTSDRTVPDESEVRGQNSQENHSSAMSRSSRARSRSSRVRQRRAELERAQARNIQNDQIDEEISIAENEIVGEETASPSEVTTEFNSRDVEGSSESSGQNEVTGEASTSRQTVPYHSPDSIDINQDNNNTPKTKSTVRNIARASTICNEKGVPETDM